MEIMNSDRIKGNKKAQKQMGLGFKGFCDKY